MRDNYYQLALGAPERGYVVNGVTYQVGSRYTPINFKAKKQTEKSFYDRVSHYLQSDFADLTIAVPDHKMKSEYVCPAAEEGGNYAAEA